MSMWRVGCGVAAVLLACVPPAESFRAPIAVGRAGVHPSSTLTATRLNRGLKQGCARAGMWMWRVRGQVLACQLETPAEHGEDSGDIERQQSYLRAPSAAAAAASAAALAICMAAPLSAVAEGGAGAQDSLVQGMIAGAIAGAAVDLVLYPIDTIKTRLQTNTMKELNVEAIPALYSGLLGSLAGHVPSSALFFAVYQTSKVYWLEPSFGEGAAVAQLLASALGNVAASTIRVPTEVVKTRLQSGGEETIQKCCAKILSQDGPGGFFRGYAAFLARDLPFDAIEFVGYEQLRIVYMTVALSAAAAGGGELAGWENSLLGAAAGGLTGALTTPLDTVRARSMNEAGTGETKTGSVLATARLLFETEGLAGLFAGVVPRTLWLALGGTVFFSSLEAVKSSLH